MFVMKKYPVVVFALWLLFGACSAPAPEKATLVLYNGNIFTADSARAQATAVAIAGERILALGSDADMRALAAPGAQLIDLQGAFAMPGFIEGHGHFAGLGNSLVNLNLIQTTTWQQITDLVAEKARNTPPGAWIEGRGWHQEKWS